MKKLTPFDISKHLNESSKDLWSEHQYDYSPFMTNKIMSMHADTISIANEMNLRWKLPKDMQYDFYLNIINKKKRYGKYVSSKKDLEVEKIKEEFQCNTKNARIIIELLLKEGVEL